jgi:apolipoprotein N-acyltransferase
VIEGPRVWRSRIAWWRGFRRDAVNRARETGLATRWMPLAPLSGALIGTGVGAGFFVFTDPLAYLAIIVGVQILSVAVSLVSGWTLTDKGWRERALWHSFARYIRQQGKIDRDVGPEGVVVWGPYLVYGAVLGEAHGAAAPLTP